MRAGDRYLKSVIPGRFWRHCSTWNMHEQENKSRTAGTSELIIERIEKYFRLWWSFHQRLFLRRPGRPSCYGHPKQRAAPEKSRIHSKNKTTNHFKHRTQSNI